MKKEREFGQEAPDAKFASGRPEGRGRRGRGVRHSRAGWLIGRAAPEQEGLGWCPAGGPGRTHHVTPEHGRTGAESPPPALADPVKPGKELAPETGQS